VSGKLTIFFIKKISLDRLVKKVRPYHNFGCISKMERNIVKYA